MARLDRSYVYFALGIYSVKEMTTSNMRYEGENVEGFHKYFSIGFQRRD